MTCPTCQQPILTWYSLHDELVKSTCQNPECLAHGLIGKGECVRESQDHFAGLIQWKEAKERRAA
jgi:hypothetical protein